MALLNSSQPSSVYVDPRASVLYGAGNNNITPAVIRDYITSPGRSDKDVLGAALANNVSVDQITAAMKDNPAYASDNVNNYLAGQGITRDMKPGAVEYEPIQYTPIANVEAVQDPTKGTVAGQLSNVLDPNSPVMQRAATYGNQQANSRGLLNSSMGISSAYAPMIDAGLQIATPDAASNNQFKLFNADSANKTNQFNASNALSAGVANAGNVKDIAMNSANLSNQLAIANLDTNTKLKIANINALSNDSQLASSMNQSLMNAIVEINKQDKPIDVRTAEIQQLVNLTSNSIGLLQSFDSAIPSLKFDDITGVTGSSGTAGANASAGTATGSQSGNQSNNPVNVLGYGIEPSVLGNVTAYEKKTGTEIPRNKIAPEQLVHDIMAIGNPSGAMTYIGSDGQTHVANPNAYNVNELMKSTGAKNYGDLFNRLFQPVYVPGTMRADQIQFYMYR